MSTKKETGAGPLTSYFSLLFRCLVPGRVILDVAVKWLAQCPFDDPTGLNDYSSTTCLTEMSWSDSDKRSMS
jgi:hypothetical protein